MEFIIIISAISSIEFQIGSYKFWELSRYPYAERVHSIISVVFKDRTNATVLRVQVHCYSGNDENIFGPPSHNRQAFRWR